MDLKSGYPFWAIKNGLMATFPPLERDARCDVVVVGGGITGALIAHELTAGGHDVVVIEKRDVGWGSTAASTAMLQYEIDTELAELAERYGEARAVAIYRACEQAIGELEQIAKGVPGAGFTRATSLYYASHLWHARRLRAEGELRARHGFHLDVLDREALRSRFGISAPIGLYTHVAAHVDPYHLAIGLLRGMARDGTVVCDRTAMRSFRPHTRGVEIRTTHDTIRCKHLVLASGYEAQTHLRKRVARNRSSYALVTEPVRDAPEWLARTLVWESARPYLYMRGTRDGRLVMGGEDDSIDVPMKRDAYVERKSARILKKANQLLPQLSFEPSYAWAGTFAETEDGLPYFGPSEEHGPRVSFAMAYGGNGIAYSAIGAKVLRAHIERRKHPLGAFLSFSRAQ